MNSRSRWLYHGAAVDGPFCSVCWCKGKHRGDVCAGIDHRFRRAGCYPSRIWPAASRTGKGNWNRAIRKAARNKAYFKALVAAFTAGTDATVNFIGAAPPRKERPKKPRPSAEVTARDHARLMLKRAKTRLKRAETLVKKWNRRLRAAERKLIKAGQ